MCEPLYNFIIYYTCVQIMNDCDSTNLTTEVPETHPHSVDLPCCRVCHSESEPNRPLFHPCKCDGSIKYVHQDCLTEWVRFSRQAEPKCELCGERIHFRNVYSADAPEKLSFFGFFYALIVRVTKLGKECLPALISAIAWYIFVPLFTAWWLDVCYSLVVDTNIEIFPKYFSDLSYSVLTSWRIGLFTVAVIVMISVAVIYTFSLVTDVRILIYVNIRFVYIDIT